MAYSTSNPPRMMVQSIGNVAPALWFLTGTDAAAAVDTSGYITNGGALGMKANDVVLYFDTNLNIGTFHRVASVSATSPGAVDLGDGTTIASATNTD
jgi:hypothetical protein